MSLVHSEFGAEFSTVHSVRAWLRPFLGRHPWPIGRWCRPALGAKIGVQRPQASSKFLAIGMRKPRSTSGIHPDDSCEPGIELHPMGGGRYWVQVRSKCWFQPMWWLACSFSVHEGSVHEGSVHEGLPDLSGRMVKSASPAASVTRRASAVALVGGRGRRFAIGLIDGRLAVTPNNGGERRARP
jgi:hypothetical protein